MGDLRELKRRYKSLQKKYDLPDFDSMNKEFSIEKIKEDETEYLTRELVRVIHSKLIDYLHFIGTLLNPVNSQMFILSLAKILDGNDKKVLAEIYSKLARFEVEFWKSELFFSEEFQAEYIRKAYGLWNEIREELKRIYETIELKWNNDFDKRSKGYLG